MWNKVLKDTEKKEKYIEYVKTQDKQIGSFLEFSPADRGEHSTDASASGAKTVGLSGIPYGVKDNIAVKGFHLTCGSKILENFISPYNATAVERLSAAGAVPVGKCNMDEFGMGSSTDNSALGVTNNPWDLERVAGGSSGGSAAAVAAGFVPFALGSDTGGSVRQPASFCGVYGLKPTYGAVSRYGLVSYASSLDVIGLFSKDISLMETVFDTIKGFDGKDQTSIDYPSQEEEVAIPEKPSFAYLGGDLGLSPEVEEAYKNCIAFLKGKGFDVKEATIPVLDYVIPAYYTIATGEASANLSRYNGIRYGYRSEGTDNYLDLMKKTRHEGFGDEVKLRILLGTYVLRSGFQDRYYIKAQKIRTKIINDLNALFKSSDLLLLPTFPTPPFRHGNEDLSQHQQKVADKFTVTANLAGIPALNFPAGVYKELPVGLQLFAPHCRERLLFRAAEIMADGIGVPDLPGFKNIENILKCADNNGNTYGK